MALSRDRQVSPYDFWDSASITLVKNLHLKEVGRTIEKPRDAAQESSKSLVD